MLAVISFLLRIFYVGHLYQDDGLWFTAAGEIIRGKALYREIYFDKPPGLPLVYAALFKAFGAHILTIRLFTILYSVAISAVLYCFGSRLYSRRVGMIAAAMFVVFSTTYTTGHVQGLNTDFLMLLPYTAGAYLLIRSRFDPANSAGLTSTSGRLALAGGALIGIGFNINPKAAFDLGFFILLLVVSRKWLRRSEDGETESGKRSHAAYLLGLTIAGFAVGSLPFLVYLAAEGSISDYVTYVWAWGSRYAAYYSLSEVVVSALRHSASYLILNNTLLVGTAFVIVQVISEATGRRANLSPEQAAGAGFSGLTASRADRVLLLWAAISYLGLAVGGRFFGHYFFQIMPALCLLGARGLDEINSALRRRSVLRWIIFSMLTAGFVVTMVRFHSRTAILASDWIRGARSEQTSAWFHERLNREERRVAAVVREFPDREEAADRLALEEMREAHSGDDESSNYIFVWGYRPEIYYWSGLLPASRYLSTQPLTGVPADVHFFEVPHQILFDSRTTADARNQLVRDLEQSRPTFIIDELGAFNSELAITKFDEMSSLMEEYKHYAMTDRFLIYKKKVPKAERIR
ncbi:MAG TPA: glycosyltransferase family 39 protein [Blastocatellia bacterium]|nr:glycosyltransferase family 39 protein [Blastocatellia bacterium]